MLPFLPCGALPRGAEWSNIYLYLPRGGQHQSVACTPTAVWVMPEIGSTEKRLLWWLGAEAGCVVRKEHRQHKHTNTTVGEIGTNIVFHTTLEQVHELKPSYQIWSRWSCLESRHTTLDNFTLPPPFVEIMEQMGPDVHIVQVYTTHYSVSQ